MAVPTFEAFTASAKKTLSEIGVAKDELSLLDTKGPSFHFYDDGGVDSLDMLDVVFYIEHDLDIRLGLEQLIHSEQLMTLQNLYDSIRQDADTPA